MSTQIIRIIPDDPHYLPDEQQQLKAVQLLQWRGPSAEEITIQISDTIEFIDQGENFEAIFCSQCDIEIDSDWWQSAMDTAHRFSFENLQVVTPCCASEVSLNDLKYQWPAGFARFLLELRDPEPGFMLDSDTISQLEAALGCDIRQIIARY